MSPLFLPLFRHRGGFGAVTVGNGMNSYLLPAMYQQCASFVDVRIKYVRDRALDHAVEKEKHLQCFHGLKDLILLNPNPSTTASTPSLFPLSYIYSNRDNLSFPFRPIFFIRSFPTAFIEHPATAPAENPQPLISPTPELVRLHEEEMGIYDSCRLDSADRLLKLIMLTKSKKIPLSVVDKLRWDLGLPRDYAKSLLPHFPDYFEINGKMIELVCWNKDLAVSELEKKGVTSSFNLQYPTGFEMNIKVKNWMDEWQKLPYPSPYSDRAMKLDSSSAAGEKTSVAVLHELLSLFVGKKTEKDNLLLLGEHIGLRSGFKKSMVNYPGIFYLSFKNMTQTVVLREAYKRDLPVSVHPFMAMRYKFIHLMHKGKVVEDTAKSGSHKKKGKVNLKNGKEGEMEYDKDDGDNEVEDEEEEDELDAVSSEDFDSESNSEDELMDITIHPFKGNPTTGKKPVRIEENRRRRRNPSVNIKQTGRSPPVKTKLTGRSTSGMDSLRTAKDSQVPRRHKNQRIG